MSSEHKPMRLIASTIGTALTLAVVAGCSSTPASVTSTPSASNGASGGKAVVTTPPSQLTVAWSGTPIVSLDPDVAFFPQDEAALHLIGGTLFELRADDGVVPGLASAMSTSSDGLTNTITLRPNLKFSDGSPLTSADVKATLDRSVQDKTNVYSNFTANFDKITAPAPDTVVLTLHSPDSALATLLAEPAFPIVPADKVNGGADFYRAPISAGPYKLESWGGGSDSSYVSNPNYWGPKPVVSTVRFNTVPDFNTAVAQLRTGAVDMAEGLPMSVQPQLDGIGAWKLNDQYGFYGIQLNNTKAPFNNINVRKAVTLAVDRSQLNQVIWRGYATPISQFWPSTMTGYDPSISAVRDVEKAKTLLQGTPCASGCSIELDANPSNVQIAQVVAANLADIGIHASVTQISFNAQTDKANSLNYQAMMNSIYDFVNIPEGLLDFAARPGGYFNGWWTGWNNPQINAAADDAVANSGDKQKAALAKVNSLFQQDAPYVTLATVNDLWASRVDWSIVSIPSTNFVEISRAGS